MELTFFLQYDYVTIGRNSMTSVQLFLSDIWNRTLSVIKESNHFDEAILKNFFENDITITDIDNNVAYLLVPTVVHREVINKEKAFILTSLKQVNDSIQNIQIILPNEVNTKPSKRARIFENSEKNNLVDKFTFQNFVVGPSNKESNAAAIAVSFSPGQLYNPLFIYGSSGLGKTHLLHAIGNYIKKNTPDLNVLYIQSTDFVSKVQNIKTKGGNSYEELKEEFARLDVLLIDDIQFLATGEKIKSQEIFFQIFNTLIQNKKQVVITSDCYPTELSGLEERLISRFFSGLSVGVSSPAFDTAVAILKQKLETQSFDVNLIDDEVINYLATNFSKDIRKLEGQLNRLLFYGINFEEGGKITLSTAVNAFKGQINDQNIQDITSSKIKRYVCDYYGITKSQLISKVRTKQISNARHIAIHLHRRHLDWPFVKIGEEFGKRDHSTIISSVEKVDLLLKKDELFKTAYSEIEKKLLSK